MKTLHAIVITTILSLTFRAQALPTSHVLTGDVSTQPNTVHHDHSALVSRLAESLLVNRALTNPREKLDDMKTKAQGFFHQHKVLDLLRELSEMEKDFGRKTSTPKNVQSEVEQTRIRLLGQLDAGTMVMGKRMETIKRSNNFGLMFDYDWKIFDKFHPAWLPMALKPIIPDEYSGQTLLALGEEYLTKSTDQDVVIGWQLRLLTGIMMVQNGHNELFFGFLAQLPATYKRSTKSFVKERLELMYQFYCMIAVTRRLPVPFEVPEVSKKEWGNNGHP